MNINFELKLPSAPTVISLFSLFIAIFSATSSWKSASSAQKTIELAQRPEVIVIPDPVISLKSPKNLLIFKIENLGQNAAIIYKINYSIGLLPVGTPYIKNIEPTRFYDLDNLDLFKGSYHTYKVGFSPPKIEYPNYSEIFSQLNIDILYKDRSGDSFIKKTCWIYAVSAEKITLDHICPFNNETIMK